MTNGKVQSPLQGKCSVGGFRTPCKESVPWVGSEPPARKVFRGWIQNLLQGKCSVGGFRTPCKESVPWVGSEPPARKVFRGWIQSPLAPVKKVTRQVKSPLQKKGPVKGPEVTMGGFKTPARKVTHGSRHHHKDSDPWEGPVLHAKTVTCGWVNGHLQGPLVVPDTCLKQSFPWVGPETPARKVTLCKSRDPARKVTLGSPGPPEGKVTRGWIQTPLQGK